MDESKRAQLRACYESSLNIVLEHNRKHRQRHQARSEGQGRDPAERSELGDKAAEERLGEGATEESSDGDGNGTLITGEGAVLKSEDGEKSATETEVGERLGSEEESCNKVDNAGSDGGVSRTEGDGGSEEERTTSPDENKTKESDEKMELGDGNEDGAEDLDRSERRGSGEGSAAVDVDVFPPEPLIESIAFPCISTGIYGMYQFVI